ncbi:MAG: FKBP-type peptidyl-prolyl cis-trans isomerase [Ignavibacteria bacterium]|nr:FKBP-type peptidyl-prolyl cis-trans isomerase [Ignavibacteria bacterium]
MIKQTSLFHIIILIVSFVSGSFAGDTVTTSSGLKYIVLKQGSGKKSVNGKIAEVHYTGWLHDGKKFDSSRDRNTTFEFTLGAKQVIKGWDEGVALMRIGDEFRLILPPELAYGENGAGEVIPPNATLVFDVELIGVHKATIPIVDTLMSIIVNKNVEAAIETYEILKYEREDDYNFKEPQLNNLGYQLLQLGLNKDAVKIFKLNVEQFPKSANVYDSLGEAYMISGDKKNAIKNYEKSLKLDPNNENAKKMLEQLRSN